MDKSRKLDIAIGVLFGIMTIILIYLFFSNNIFFMVRNGMKTVRLSFSFSLID